jgi:hypothetical protein
VSPPIGTGALGVLQAVSAVIAVMAKSRALIRDIFFAFTLVLSFKVAVLAVQFMRSVYAGY